MLKQFSFAVVITALLAGCFGGKFEKLEVDQIAIGADTPKTIKQKMGGPNKVEDLVQEDGTQIKIFAYFHVGPQYKSGEIQPVRQQNFYFFEDKLIGHDFSSSWEIDSTDFDESKVDRIEKGTTTIQEVIELFGNPGGEARYPLIRKDQGAAKSYTYKKSLIFMSPLRYETYFKVLMVTHDENGIVTEAIYRTSRKGSSRPF